MIRPVLCTFALSLCTVPALADEKPKPVAQPAQVVDVKPIGGQPVLGPRIDQFSIAYLQGYLYSDVVREDLKVTDAQFVDVKKAQDELQKKTQQMAKDLADKIKAAEKPEDKQAIVTEHYKKVQELQAEAFKGVLKPEQLARLKQIAIQIQGPYAFANPEIGEKLKLTDEQKTKQREVMGQMQKDWQETIKEMIKDGGKLDQEKYAAKLKEHQKKLMEGLSKELTADQAAAWKELVGPAFDMERFQKNTPLRPQPVPLPAPIQDKPVPLPVERVPLEKPPISLPPVKPVEK